jgi:DNA polymerase III subunit epsilon
MNNTETAATRVIFLDTETTGLEVHTGHRIIEVAGVEMINRQLTGRHFHEYVHPEREIDAGAQEVHGITLAFLEDKPKFAAIAGALQAYLAGAELVIHNAPFDVGFLNAEFARLDGQKVEQVCAKITDSLVMARELHPGQRNSLDALCKRYGIDNSGRTLHGALLDAELLAEVYLAMTRGQDSLLMDTDRADDPAEIHLGTAALPELIILRATDAELEAHAQQLAEIDKASKGACIWQALQQAGTE